MKHASELVFVDHAITEISEFLAGLRPDLEAIVLTSSEHPIKQIARALSQRKALSSIHIVAHGRPGEVIFGSGSMSIRNLNEHARDLSSIGTALGRAGGLFLWSCCIAQGTRGSTFINAFARFTHAKIAAAKGLV